MVLTTILVKKLLVASSISFTAVDFMLTIHVIQCPSQKIIYFTHSRLELHELALGGRTYKTTGWNTIQKNMYYRLLNDEHADINKYVHYATL